MATMALHFSVKSNEKHVTWLADSKQDEKMYSMLLRWD